MVTVNPQPTDAWSCVLELLEGGECLGVSNYQQLKNKRTETQDPFWVLPLYLPLYDYLPLGATAPHKCVAGWDRIPRP